MRIQTLSLLLGFLTTACVAPAGLRSPQSAQRWANSAADDLGRVDALWLEGNRSQEARAILDELLTGRPDDPELLVRRVLLAEQQLETEVKNRDLLQLLRIGQELPFALALAWDHERWTRPERRQLFELLSAGAPGATKHEWYLLRARVSHELGHEAEFDKAMVGSGLLRHMRFTGPFEGVGRTLPADSVSLAGLPGRNVIAGLSGWVPSAGLNRGLYEGHTWFRSVGGTTRLIIRTNASAAVWVDGQQVMRDDGDGVVQPLVRSVHMTVRAGWHQIRTRIVAGRGQYLLAAATGPAQIVETTLDPPAGATASGIAVFASKENTRAATVGLFERFRTARMGVIPAQRDIEASRAAIRAFTASERRNNAAWSALEARLAIVEGMPRNYVESRLRTAIKLDASQKHARISLAGMLASQKPEQGLALLEGLSGSEAAAIRFDIFRSRGWHAEATLALSRAVAERPSASLLRMGANFLRGQWAVEAAKALDARAKAREGHLSMQRVEEYLRQGQVEQALKVCRQAAARTWHPALWLNRMAEIELMRGNGANARAATDAALNLDGRDQRALRLKAIETSLSESPHAALDLMTELHALGAIDLNSLKFFAELQERTPGVPAAGSWLERTLQIDPIRLATDSRAQSGHDREWLLDRLVEHVSSRGDAVSLVHYLTRLGNKRAIDAIGEYGISDGELPLVLRTIKADGTLIDVDQHEGKHDVSFAGLSAGDAVEQKTLRVTRRSRHTGAYFQQFFFQDSVPNNRSEYFVAADRGVQLRWRAFNGAPEPEIHASGDRTVFSFRVRDMPAVEREPLSVDPLEYRPHVAVWSSVDDEARAVRMEGRFRGLTRPSFDIVARANALRATSRNESDRIDEAARFVWQKVRPGPTLDPTKALLTGSGNRTLVLLALLQAMDIDARLVVARQATQPLLEEPFPGAHGYEDRIIEVKLRDDDRSVWIEADPKFMTVGGLRPSYEGATYKHALDLSTIHLFDATDIDTRPISAQLVLSLATNGDAVGTLDLRYPHAYGSALRSIVQRVRGAALKVGLQSALARVISGVSVDKLEVVGGEDPLAEFGFKLDLKIPTIASTDGSRMTIHRFFHENPAGSQVGIPPLSKITTLAKRKTTLMLPPHRETLSVQMRLPPGCAVEVLPPKHEVEHPWGGFSQNTVDGGDVLSMTRKEWRHVSRIRPGAYKNFKAQAEQLALLKRSRVVLQCQ